MKGSVSKIIRIWLAVCFLISMLALQAFAAEDAAEPTEQTVATEATEETTAPTEETVPENTSTGEIPSEETVPFTEDAQISEPVPGEAMQDNTVASGICGEKLTWVLDDVGTLTISGEGELGDFSSYIDSSLYKTHIISVVIENGVTSIGSYAFTECSSLTSVTLPDSITSIGDSTFNNCSMLTSITIPEGVTSIGNAAFFGCSRMTRIILPESVISIGNHTFELCSSLTSVTIPEGVTSIGDSVFSYCGMLSSITIPKSVTSIGKSAFSSCGNLTSISIPEGVTTIGDFAFSSCQNLISVTIPEGLTSIGDHTFYNCRHLANITIPQSITAIASNAFAYCSDLETVYYGGTEEQWSNISIGSGNDNLTSATIHYNSTAEDESVGSISGLQIYSDYPNLSVQTGGKITLAAGILENGERTDTASNITFQVGDTTVLNVTDTGIRDNCRYVELTGSKEGMTSVLFTDTSTGETKKIPVNVYVNNRHAYTLSTVPTQYIDKYPTNLYNVNGLYVDSYQYTVHEDQSASVSFTVYNTNYTYGTVEVYKENGDIYNIILIDKMTSSNTSIKESVWDNVGYLINDALDGDFLTYRQESGFSKETSVSVEIPPNGYLVIATDPQFSLPVALINAADILMSTASLAGDIEDYASRGKVFSENLTRKLLTNQTYATLIKDGNKYTQKLWKNVGESLFVSKESIGNFANTVAKNLNELNAGEIIAETAWDCGWDVGEDVVTYFMGPVNNALDIAFIIGKWSNFISQASDFVNAIGSRLILIQNQGGGFRSSQEIKVESDTDFDEEIALNVFEIEIDSDMMAVLETMNPELFETIREGNSYTYNISLLKNREEIQPNGEVTVFIPIPEELTLLAHSGKTNIYRIEEDGSMTNMNAVIEDDCFVFVTDHFSLYTIVGFAPMEVTLRGDVNNDGQVTSADAVFLLWHTLFPKNYPIDADVDYTRDGVISVEDAVYLLWHTLFPEVYPL